MPYLFARLLVAFTCFCAGPLWAASAAPVGTIVLGDSTPSFQVSSDTQAWIDTSSRATIEVASISPKSFEFGPALRRLAIGDQDTLWIKLILMRPVGSSAEWTLSIPLPFVDSVTLYQADPSGGWSVQKAGDTIAQMEWSKKWLYPEFDLSLVTGAPQVVYLRVRNFKHLSIPIRLVTQPEREYQRILEIATIGLILGTLLALSALSVIRYFEHGKLIDIWAALYSAMVMLTTSEINGVLNVLLWPNMPEFGNYAYSAFPVVAVGGALLFVRELYSLSTQYHRFDRFLDTVGWGTIASVLTFAFLDRPVADKVCAIILAFATTVGMGATLLSWRGKSPIWGWLLLAYLPQYLALLRLLAEAMGLAPTMWEMRYLMSLSVAMAVPVLIYALSQATHDRKELAIRARHLPTQDALTGLLTPEAFHGQLADAHRRAIEGREPIALVLVHIINHEHIRRALGDPVAEQSLLRAVVKLHRILRDVDPAGRVGTSHFGLLLDGVANRQVLTERMVQLIASGLVPLPGLTPPVTLQFHVACVLLHENPIEPLTAIENLTTLLTGMSPQTRRPIRFLEPEPTQAAALHIEVQRA